MNPVSANNLAAAYIPRPLPSKIPLTWRALFFCGLRGVPRKRRCLLTRRRTAIDPGNADWIPVTRVLNALSAAHPRWISHPVSGRFSPAIYGAATRPVSLPHEPVLKVNLDFRSRLLPAAGQLCAHAFMNRGTAVPKGAVLWQENRWITASADHWPGAKVATVFRDP